MNLFRAPLRRGYFLSILGFMMILGSYFLPFAGGSCNEFSPCGPSLSLVFFILSNLQNIHTFSDFITSSSSFFLFVLAAPLLMATLFVLLGWLYIRFESRTLLNILLIVWVIGFIEFVLFSWFILIFGGYPIFGFWGTLLGYGILFYAYTIWGWHKKSKQEQAQS